MNTKGGIALTLLGSLVLGRAIAAPFVPHLLEPMPWWLPLLRPTLDVVLLAASHDMPWIGVPIALSRSVYGLVVFELSRRFRDLAVSRWDHGRDFMAGLPVLYLLALVAVYPSAFVLALLAAAPASRRMAHSVIVGGAVTWAVLAVLLAWTVRLPLGIVQETVRQRPGLASAVLFLLVSLPILASIGRIFLSRRAHFGGRGN